MDPLPRRSLVFHVLKFDEVHSCIIGVRENNARFTTMRSSKVESLSCTRIWEGNRFPFTFT